MTIIQKNYLNKFEKKFEKMIIAGGPHVAISFFEQQLIDELWPISYEKVNEQEG